MSCKRFPTQHGAARWWSFGKVRVIYSSYLRVHEMKSRTTACSWGYGAPASQSSATGGAMFGANSWACRVVKYIDLVS